MGAEVSNVVAFRDSIPPGEANPDLVSVLESLLSRAKTGDLRGMAYATSSVGNVTDTGWEGSDGARHPLAAAIMILHHRYAAALMEPS